MKPRPLPRRLGTSGELLKLGRVGSLYLLNLHLFADVQISKSFNMYGKSSVVSEKSFSPSKERSSTVFWTSLGNPES